MDVPNLADTVGTWVDTDLPNESLLRTSSIEKGSGYVEVKGYLTGRADSYC